MIAARVYTTVHMYTRRAAPELHTELKADTGRYVDVHSLCIAMRLGRAASVEVALIRDALCRSALEIRYTLEHYELRNELRYEKGIRNEKRAS